MNRCLFLVPDWSSPVHHVELGKIIATPDALNLLFLQLEKKNTRRVSLSFHFHSRASGRQADTDDDLFK